MKTKVIDVSFVTLGVPELSDRFSLGRQFKGRTCGNDEHLERASAVLKRIGSSKPISVHMIQIDIPLGGVGLWDAIETSCDAVQVSINNLVAPTLPQVGALTDHFCREWSVRRAIPIVIGDKAYYIQWERSDWVSHLQPVFRFFDQSEPIQDLHWMMLPTAR